MRAAALVLIAGCGRFGFGAPHDDAAAIDADTSGLVAWLPMETIANALSPDASGHGHDATCSGSACPVVVAGKLGYALRFDGANDLLSIPGGGEVETLTSFTVAAWLWVDTPPAATSCPLNKPIGSGLDDTWQLCVTSGLAVFFGTSISANMGDSLLTPTNLVTTQAWHHIAVEWDGTGKQVWIDGTMHAGDQAQVTFDGSPVTIGLDLDSGAPAAAYAGIIDEVRIYDRALTGSEIAQLAQ